ncbi:bile acid:sodium symporter [Methylogaea oryzae]|uniref:bile acid:sodium symporter n=1 Tax=Methylogaea oryzae TaxID=1295382 RepID=UPI0009E88B0E|nr:bile acid:sodium symporter [Methylogaea oryzae]
MAMSSNVALRLAEHLHHNLLRYILVAYSVAAVFPEAGLAIRNINFLTISIFDETVQITVPAALLATLLFNAGLGIRVESLFGLVKRPLLLILGLAANLAIPLAFILAISIFMLPWHNPTEVQYILVGLALIASMPIAGSSSAWSQNADGDLALSLGLVILSTCLSPLTTPMALNAAGWVANDVYAQLLNELADHQTKVFLAMFVFLPTTLGIGARRLMREGQWEQAKPLIKPANTMVLLTLIYSNAAVALPQALANPDWDFFAALTAILVLLSVVTFGSGWMIAQACG